MVALGRVELPTFGLGNRCSIHLSYRAMNGMSLRNGCLTGLRGRREVSLNPTKPHILSSDNHSNNCAVGFSKCRASA